MKYTLTTAKETIKEMGLYYAIYELAGGRYNDIDDLKEIVLRVLDEIPSDILNKAIKKGTR